MCNLQMKSISILEEILPTRFLEVLDRSGICTIKQIIILSVWDIKKLTNLSADDINFLKTTVCQSLIRNYSTSGYLLQIENKNKNVISGCNVLDTILKGGFRRGTITEIYGESGSGKTQIAIQAVAYNWSEGSVYICTEDLFPVKRYEQIKKNLPNFNSSIDYGKNIYIEHITEAQDLLACINIRLPKLLSKKKMALIVLDSVAAPFRVESSNYVQRAEELRELAMSLLKIAQEHNIAVVCINQVTAAFSQPVEVMPSLGLAWSNMICMRLWLKKTNIFSENSIGINTNVRELSVVFSPDLPNATAKLIITSRGITGIN